MENLPVRIGDSLPQVLRKLTESDQQCSEVSLYNDPKATEKHVTDECKRLAVAFPSITPQMIAVMMQRIQAKGMTGKQVTDAINNVIDNFKYPCPTVADIVGWDKKVKLYTHDEARAMLEPGCTFTDWFETIKVKGQVKWIRK